MVKGKDIQVVVADPNEVLEAIGKYYGEETGDVSEILKQLGEDEKIAEEITALGGEMDDEAIVASLANEAPIVKFVNLVLFQAVKDRASDIHFEPFETEFRIRSEERRVGKECRFRLSADY